jgi:hypothetical protein
MEPARQLLGGAGGGAGGLLGNLGGLLNNPQIMSMAQSMLSNPDLVNSLSSMMASGGGLAAAAPAPAAVSRAEVGGGARVCVATRKWPFHGSPGVPPFCSGSTPKKWRLPRTTKRLQATAKPPPTRALRTSNGGHRRVWGRQRFTVGVGWGMEVDGGAR